MKKAKRRKSRIRKISKQQRTVGGGKHHHVTNARTIATSSLPLLWHYNHTLVAISLRDKVEGRYTTLHVRRRLNGVFFVNGTGDAGNGAGVENINM